jgi:hypothetical protein
MQSLETATSVHSNIGRGVRHFIPRTKVVNPTPKRSERRRGVVVEPS